MCVSMKVVLDITKLAMTPPQVAFFIKISCGDNDIRYNFLEVRFHN